MPRAITTRSTIGDQLGMRELAMLHRPRTRDEMRVAVHELANRGMIDYGIAAATGLAVEQVRRVLGEVRHA